MKRSRDALRRILIETAGWTLVVGGVLALALPGPGLLMLLGGLAVLSQQYAWAERRVRPVERAALRAASEGVQSRFRIFLSLLGCVWLWSIGALWVVHPPAPAWWPVRNEWWLVGGLATGATLIASGFIALTFIIYSVKRFRGTPYVPDDEPVREPA